MKRNYLRGLICTFFIKTASRTINRQYFVYFIDECLFYKVALIIQK